MNKKTKLIITVIAAAIILCALATSVFAEIKTGTYRLNTDLTMKYEAQLHVSATRASASLYIGGFSGTIMLDTYEIALSGYYSGSVTVSSGKVVTYTIGKLSSSATSTYPYSASCSGSVGKDSATYEKYSGYCYYYIKDNNVNIDGTKRIAYLNEST